MAPRDSGLNEIQQTRRADDLSTTDSELEAPDNKSVLDSVKEDEFVHSVNDAAEPEGDDEGLDEEA